MNTRQEIHVSIEGPNDGPFNMFEDQALLTRAEAGRAGGRIYRWDRTWVSLGRFQDPASALVSPETTRVVRRPTGGAAVLHGNDITVSLALPISAFPDDTRKVKEIYQRVVQPFAEAFKALKISGVLGDSLESGGARPDSPYCFGFNSKNDVINEENGQKLMGCALRITRKAVLIQASFPYREAHRDEPADSILIGGQDLTPSVSDVTGWTNALLASWRSNLGSVPIDFIGGVKELDRVRLGLWNLWDPIGVHDAPEAYSEYDGYAGTLTGNLHPVHTLGRIRTEFMSLSPNEAADRKFASFLQDSLSASC